MSFNDRLKKLKSTSNEESNGDSFSSRINALRSDNAAKYPATSESAAPRRAAEEYATTLYPRSADYLGTTDKLMRLAQETAEEARIKETRRNASTLGMINDVIMGDVRNIPSRIKDYANAKKTIKSMEPEQYRSPAEQQRDDLITQIKVIDKKREAAKREANTRTTMQERASISGLANTEARADAQAYMDDRYANLKALDEQRADLIDQLHAVGGKYGVGDFVGDALDALQSGLQTPLATLDKAEYWLSEKLGLVDRDDKNEYDRAHALENEIAQQAEAAMAGRNDVGRVAIGAFQSAGNVLGSTAFANATGIPQAAQQVLGPIAANLSATEAQLGAKAGERIAAGAQRFSGNLLGDVVANPTNFVISAQSGIGAYDRAKTAGASDSTAFAAALANAAAEYYSNKMFSGTPLLDSPEEKGYVVELIEAAAEKAGKSDIVARLFSNGLVNFVFDKSGEGLEEVITGVLDPLIEKLTYNPDADLATASDLFDEYIGGVAMSLLLGAAEPITNFQGRKAEARAEDALRTAANAGMSGIALDSTVRELQRSGVNVDIEDLQPAYDRGVQTLNRAAEKFGVDAKGKTGAQIRRAVDAAIDAEIEKARRAPMSKMEVLDMAIDENGKLGENGAKYARELYRVAQTDDVSTTDWFAGFNSAYQAGRNGAEIEQNRFTEKLTPQVRQAAYNAGQADAILAESKAEAPAKRFTFDIQQTEDGKYAVEVTDTQSGKTTSGGVYDTMQTAESVVKDFKAQTGGIVNEQTGNESEERNAGVPKREERNGIFRRTAEIEQRREAGKRRAESIRNSVAAAEDGEEVSSREAGISGGTDEKSMRIVRKYEDDETRSIKADAKKRGLNVVFFTGEIEAKKGEKIIKARGEYSADGKTLYVCLDDPDFTARQIYDHEEFHARAHNDAELQQLCENIINSHSAAELEEMVRAYVNAYGWTDMTNEEIMQEILADAYAGIDIFNYLSGFEGATMFSEDVRGAVKAREGEQQKERGPPAEDLYSLKLVNPVKPSSTAWTRGATYDEVKAAHPTLYELSSEEQDTRNPTQITSTVKTYRKIYDALRNEGFDGTILDASSGLGVGTQAGREEYGFKVDDIEPFPDKSYTPKYTDYSRLNKQYDVVISNAVLNVLPQDLRDAMVVKIGELLAPGGRAYINVRGDDVKNAKSKIAIDEDRMEYFIADGASYQKGFKKAELKAYLEDVLGDGYTVDAKGGFGGVSVVVRKNGGARFSQKITPQQDADYAAAVERGDMETAQKMVDEAAKAAGYTIHAYHGTARVDRVGNVFRPERSTSGPMAFFTDNREIAENYARDKRDTSVAYDTDYDSYETQFRARHIKTGKDFAIYKMWGYIPMSERAKIAEKAKHVRIDYDGYGDIIYDPDAKEANGGWNWQVKEFRGDILKALNEQWLNSGNLFNEEENYLKVLEMVGVNDALRKAGFEMPRYMNPEYREEGVYDVYLKIQNPFDATTMIDEDFITGFEEFAEENEDQYRTESQDADYWDKNNVSAEQFAERMRSDLEQGTTHAWTSIPDVVTAYLKQLGYDGIKDAGGKNGGVGHTVWIPFTGEQVKRSAPVTYDENGNVIPLSERFNPENEDIRYSQKLTAEDELRRQNEDLKQRVEYWKGQTKRTTVPTARAADAEKMGRQVVKDYDSTADVKEIGAALKDLTDYIMRGENITYAEVKDRAVEIARELVENAKTLREGDGETYREVRDALRKKIVISPQDAHDITPDGWGAWRNAHLGKVNVSINGKGTPVDTVYAELSERVPALFPEDITHPADQLLHMVDVIDELTPVYENPFSYNMAEAIEYAANDIIDRVMGDDIRMNPPTVADKAAAKLAAEKARGAEKAARVREQKNAEIADLKARNAWATAQRIAEVRKQRDAKIAALKEHYAEQRKAASEKKADSAARTRLLKIAKRLQNKKLPAVSMALLEQYIGNLDTVSKSITGKSIENLVALRDWYDDQKANNPDFIADAATEAKIARLSKMQIGDMTPTQVAELTEVLLNFENEINTQRRMIDSKDKRDTRQMVLESLYNVEETKGSKKTAADWLVTNTLTPERLVKRLTGYAETDPLLMRTRELADGQRRMFDYQRRAEERFSRWANNRKLMDRLRSKERVKIMGYANGRAVEVEITPDMRMALYLHSLNDENMKHIANGGVTIPDIDTYLKGDIGEAYSRGKTIKISPSNIRSIAAGMSAEERAYAKAAHDYFNGMSRDEINAVSEKLVGYSIAGVDDYFPIETDKNFTKSDIAELKRDGTIEGMGFLKERQHASNAIYLVPLTDVLNKSIRNHAKYVGMAIPVRNFSKLWGMNAHNNAASEDNGLRQAIGHKWGERGIDAVERIISDVQNPARSEDGKLLASIRSNYAAAVLTLNASVALKQAASYPTAAAVLGWEPLIKAMGNVGRVDLDLINRYTPLQWYRSKGYSTQELGDIRSKGGVMDKVLSASIKTKSGREVPLLNWIQGIDLATTRKLWKASEYYVQQHNADLQRGSDAYYKAVADIYNRVIEETQPNYTTMQRPQILRSSNQLLQSLVMFKTQPFQNFNILYDAVGELRAAERAAKNGDKSRLPQAKKNAVNAISSNLVSAAVFAAMTMAWAYARRKKDKYEDKEGNFSPWAQIGKDVLSSEFGMIPFGSDAYNLLSSWVFGEKYYGMSNITSDSISGALDATKKAVDTLSKTVGALLDGKEETIADPETVAKELFDCAKDLSKIAGVPLENVVNLVTAVYTNVASAVNGEYVTGYEILRNTKNMEFSYNKSAAYDILYKAKHQDSEQYNELRRMMIEDGFKEKNIDSAMTKRAEKK